MAETGIVALLSAGVLTVAAALVVLALNTGTFTQGHGYTLNDARNAIGQLDKEIRGADSVTFCAGDGSCLVVAAQLGTGETQTLRYTHSAQRLDREIYDEGSGTWSAPTPLIERVVNETDQAVFDCEEGVTLLRVTIDLHIRPTPASDPIVNVHTSIRPRNFPQTAVCP